MRTLLIVANRHVAATMGAGSTCTHREHHDLRFWWPDLPVDALRGLQFDMVVIDSAARRRLTADHWDMLRAYLLRRDVIVIGDVG